MLSYWLNEAVQHWALAAFAGLLLIWLLVSFYRFLINPQGMKIMLTVITVASALSIASFFGSLHYAKVARLGVKSDLTTDQTLAALSTNITILGAIMTVAAFGVGIGALFGYAELRAATMRKTEDHLIKLIQTMQKRGELNDATASVLLESVVPDRVIVMRIPADESEEVPKTSNRMGNAVSEQPIAQGYPEDKNDTPDK
jgi:polyhydroxyalkanoate synthesis regulator phasin